MKQTDTKYELENTLACSISEQFETGHVLLEKYPEKFHDAIRSQEAIGLSKSLMAKSRDIGWDTKATQNVKGKTKDGLYLGSINCRDVSSNDD